MINDSDLLRLSLLMRYCGQVSYILESVIVLSV